MSIAPNPAEPPSPENRYRLPERAHATTDLFNLVFGSIGTRLDAAEGKSADYDAAIDRIIGQALQTVSAALTVEIEAGRAEFEAVREAFEELQSGGFSAARIAATLNGHPTVTHVQGALTTLLGLVRDLDALLPDVGETDGLKFLRAKADRSGFELAEVDLYSAALVQRVARAANVQIVKADKGKLFVLTGTFTQTVVSPATLGAGHHYLVKNAGSGNITIPASDGRTNWIMYPGEMRLFQCDGTTLRSEVLHPFRVTFLLSGTFIKPPGYEAFELHLLSAAGGGGGGWWDNSTGSAAIRANGGGAGETGQYKMAGLILPSTIADSSSISVGAGGAAGQNSQSAGGSPQAGAAGGSTSCFGLTVTGGVGGLTGSSNGVAGASISTPASFVSDLTVLFASAAGPGGASNGSLGSAATIPTGRIFGFTQASGRGGNGRDNTGPNPSTPPQAGGAGAVTILGVV